jgi:hypothetical protein
MVVNIRMVFGRKLDSAELSAKTNSILHLDSYLT